MPKKLIIIIPAFNEEKVIGIVLLRLKKVLNSFKGLDCRIVVVNDSSTDKTAQEAEKQKVVVLSHPINRGLGGALFTGFKYAKRKKADYLVTMDSDGQHDAGDIKKILQPIIEKKADLVIGIRNIQKMPFDRRIITFFSSMLTFLLFGVWCEDTQSGFRAFDRKAIEQISIKTQKMEVSSEFFSEIKKNDLKYAKVPIKVIYTEYSRNKGQSNLNSINVLVKLILRRVR